MQKRVLIIDDDVRLVAALRMRLSAAGYEVLSALNGDFGVSEAALFQPHAIILDVRMPEMDGFEVCRLIRQVPELCEIPILVLSATAGSEEILKAGGDVFVRKPYHLPKLLSLLAEATERKAEAPPERDAA